MIGGGRTWSYDDRTGDVQQFDHYLELQICRRQAYDYCMTIMCRSCIFLFNLVQFFGDCMKIVLCRAKNPGNELMRLNRNTNTHDFRMIFT